MDASKQIGSGHLMRCLTLAAQLKKKKADVVGFVSRDLEGNMFSLIEKLEYRQFVLPRHNKWQQLVGYAEWLTVPQEVDAQETIAILQEVGQVDWLIVDSYAIDRTWESMLRLHVRHIMAIDDLANRWHDVDVLLDQNYAPGRAEDYDGLVPAGCLLLMGLDYLLMRDEFYAVKEKKRKRTGKIKNVLVFFGGSDLTDETNKALDALEVFRDLKVDVVAGSGNTKAGRLAERCNGHDNWTFHYQIDYIASLMVKADLAIGAGGTTTWERCFLGLPTLVISIADNQSGGAEYYDSQGFIKYLGEAKDVSVTDIVEAVQCLQHDSDKYRRMQKSMKKIFEHHEPCKVANVLIERSV